MEVVADGAAAAEHDPGADRARRAAARGLQLAGLAVIAVGVVGLAGVGASEEVLCERITADSAFEEGALRWSWLPPGWTCRYPAQPIPAGAPTDVEGPGPLPSMWLAVVVGLGAAGAAARRTTGWDGSPPAPATIWFLRGLVLALVPPALLGVAWFVGFVDGPVTTTLHVGLAVLLVGVAPALWVRLRRRRTRLARLLSGANTVVVACLAFPFVSPVLPVVDEQEHGLVDPPAAPELRRQSELLVPSSLRVGGVWLAGYPERVEVELPGRVVEWELWPRSDGLTCYRAVTDDPAVAARTDPGTEGTCLPGDERPEGHRLAVVDDDAAGTRTLVWSISPGLGQDLEELRVGGRAVELDPPAAPRLASLTFELGWDPPGGVLDVEADHDGRSLRCEPMPRSNGFGVDAGRITCSR